MATVKIVLMNPNRPKADGRCPLAVRITVNRKRVYTSIGQTVKPEEWDEDAQRVRKNHPNSQRLNNFILKKLGEANETLLEMQTHKEEVSAKAVKRVLKPAAGVTFLAQAEAYIATLRIRGKYVQVNSEQSRIKSFKEYLGGDIAFSDITPAVLGHFSAWLEGTRKLKERSILNNLMTIRAVFSQAIKEHPTLEKFYPFGKKGISIRFPASLKVGLSAEEVKLIEDLNLVSLSPIDHARNVWLMSFYFAGVRNGDILQLRWGDFKDDRLYYSMGKNNKPGSIKVSEKVTRILDLYRPLKDGSGLVFPFLRRIKDFSNTYEVERQTAFANKNLNDHLKNVAKRAGIETNLSMHISRHTFGNIAGDKIPIQMLQKLYRHSSITTTIGYQANFIHKEADDALEAVIGF